MVIFHYDQTLDGLMTAVFDAYNRKTIPDKLLGLNEPAFLFVDEIYTVITQEDKSERVWNGLKKKVNANTLNMISYVWLSEMNHCDELIFRYVCKIFNQSGSIEKNYADDDVLSMQKIAQKVNLEKLRVIEFARFQKTVDEVYFAALAPAHNCLPLAVTHFKQRFHDQKWIIYDTKREYGYYYNLSTVTEITLDNTALIENGKLNEEVMAQDEQLFQTLWKSYFKAMTIKERINPKLHRQHMPTRYWKYLTEKQ